MSMAFWVYVLKCSDGSYYTGQTDNLEHRLSQHGAGFGSDYTRRRQPVALVFNECFGTRDEALRAERQIKNWSRAKKEALFAHDWDKLRELARPRVAPPSLVVARDERNEMEAADL